MFRLRAASAARSIGGVCLALALIPAPAAPASAAHGQTAARAERLLIASASWHGRPIREPHRHAAVRAAVAAVPRRWSAGAVAFGTGYHRAGGSLRVREVQHRLRRLGYRPGPVDGLFGPRTRAAVAWFQVKHGLPVDGRASLATVRHLRARTGAGFGRPAGGDAEQRIAARHGPPSLEPLSAAGGRESADRDTLAWWIVALALGLAALAGTVVVRARRRVVPEPRRPLGRELLAETPSPDPPRDRGTVLAYVLIPAEETDDASYREHAAAIRTECAEQGLALTAVICDREDARLAWQRPGLTTAVQRLVTGEVDYLMVTRLADPAGSDSQLRDLVKATEGEIAIARWQRTPTSRPIGRRERSHG